MGLLCGQREVEEVPPADVWSADSSGCLFMDLSMDPNPNPPLWAQLLW